MRERIVRVAGMCLLIICGVFFCFPLVWTVNTSLKDIWEVYAQPPTFPPAKVVYEGWKWVIVGPAKIR